MTPWRAAVVIALLHPDPKSVILQVTILRNRRSAGQFHAD
jgi:hypothetical protein